jgi:hypothetical protein
MDGHPMGDEGQVGIMLQCINVDMFGKQNSRSVIYIALWAGKECAEELKTHCTGMKEEIDNLKRNGILVGKGSQSTEIKYQIEFL